MHIAKSSQREADKVDAHVSIPARGDLLMLVDWAPEHNINVYYDYQYDIYSPKAGIAAVHASVNQCLREVSWLGRVPASSEPIGCLTCLLTMAGSSPTHDSHYPRWS